MNCKVILFLLVVFFLVNCFGDSHQSNDSKPYEKLKIQDGFIKGTKELTVDRKNPYYRFLGIPYARPPIDNLRFEPPKRNKKWSGIWNATKDASQCVQGVSEVVGSEDCLYINVYTPKLRGNLSVMVWIYGGIFIRGNSSYHSYGPDFLLDREVIFVSFNYRLGIFGFLSTEDLIAPGNVGLKDQQFALKWVQRNIKYFGGDPKKVTIFGESAGAASVSYQVQSKGSAGLFRSAIMESGNSLCLWALNRRARETAFETGKSLHLNVTNSTELVKGLKNVNYTSLQIASINTATAITLKNPLAGILFSPVQEPCHEGAFFCNRSDDLLKNGEYNRVPVIIGINSNEAAVTDGLPAILRLYSIKYDIGFSSLAPADLTNSSIQKSAAALLIKLHYFGILSISLQEDAAVKFVSDDQFNRPTRRAVLDMSKYSPVYFYVFSYKGLLGGGPTDGAPGVGHGEDLRYLFNKPNISGTAADLVIRDQMVTMWTNFAKYSDPTPEEDTYLSTRWLPAVSDVDNLSFLNISDNLLNEVNPFNDNMKFYDSIYRSHGSGSYDTY